jgi:hypothetical protein
MQLLQDVMVAATYTCGQALASRENNFYMVVVLLDGFLQMCIIVPTGFLYQIHHVLTTGSVGEWSLKGRQDMSSLLWVAYNVSLQSLGWIKVCIIMVA